MRFALLLLAIERHGCRLWLSLHCRRESLIVPLTRTDKPFSAHTPRGALAQGSEASAGYPKHHDKNGSVEPEDALFDPESERIIDADAEGVTLKGRTCQANTINLYTDGKEICAMIGPDPVQGIAGYGSSVHEALQMLADELVRNGVWIEVSDDRHPFNWSDPPRIID